MNYRDRRCPHCGRTNGLYTTYSYKGVRSYYNFDGEYEEESLDSATTEGGAKMYCQVCEKYVCKTTDFEQHYPIER